jgi:hypothetical protein
MNQYRDPDVVRKYEAIATPVKLSEQATFEG